MSYKTERTESRQGEAHTVIRRVETPMTTKEGVNSGNVLQIESVVECGNLLEALMVYKLPLASKARVQRLKRVKQNKGCPGVDGMNVEDVDTYMRENWMEIR